MNSERLDYSGIDQASYRGIRRVLDTAFQDTDDAGSLQDFSDFEHWFVVRDGSEVVAVTGLLSREIFVGDTSVAVAGVGGVATDARHRNHGYATRLVDAAIRFAREQRGTSFGLLQCVRHLIPFYAARGWRAIPGDLMCRQSDGRTYRSPECPMVIELDSSSWPAGLIDMNGLPW